MVPLLLLAGLAAAPVPVPDRSPAARPDSARYDVLNHGRPAGALLVVREADSLRAHYRHVDRNRGTRYELRYRFAPDGSAIAGSLRTLGLNDGVPAPESAVFRVDGDSVRWRVAGAERAATRSAGSVRLPGAGPLEQALLVQDMLRRGESRRPLLPAGSVRLELAADTVVDTPLGRTRVRLALLHRATGATPEAVWVDERGDLFASQVAWFITVRAGAASALPVLRAIELAYRAAQARAVAQALQPADVPAVAIVGGAVFDAEQGRLLPDHVVVAQGDRIVAVGPRASVRIPAGAQRVDASGRTVIPGLWEMHSHLQATTGTSSGLVQLARGITTTRDLAADTDVAVAYRDAVSRGEVLGPRTLLGGFIEGPGEWAGPSDALARTEAEARELVARYHALGYRQIKLYNLVHPDLVPAIAAEARARGLRLSGHVPRGLSADAAVRLGFDEINHAAFVFSTFYPDSLFTPVMRPYSGVAQVVAPRIDVMGAPMTALLETFRARGTVIDGTFSLWYRGFDAGPGAPTAATPMASAVDSANANWLRLVKRLHDAGVTMVAGTDNAGSATYVNELEIHVRAGVPAAAVLQMATLTSARVMGEEAERGSIAVGKVADLAIVDGNPLADIGALRRVHRVVLAGRVHDPARLLEAAGVGVP
jgi:imidazolonepropionase-like amidohydrolase